MRHFLFLAFLLICSAFNLNGQTGSLPTGSDSICRNAVALYQKLYGGAKDDIAFSVAQAVDSGFVISGYTSSFGNGGYDGFLKKINRDGNIVWSRALGGSGNDRLDVVRRTSDNGFIACGQTRSFGNTAGDAWLVKVNSAGITEWSKKYGDGNANGQIAWDVTQLSDGGYAFCGVHQFAAGVSQSFVVRTDNQGNVLWSRQYGAGGSDEAWGILEDGNFLVIVGFYNGTSLYEGYTMKLNKSDGSVAWVRGYDAENRSTWFRKIQKTSTGYQVHALVMDDFSGSNEQNYIWNLGSDGSVQNIRKTVIPSVYTSSFGWHSQGDGGFVISNSGPEASAEILLTKVSSAGSIEWSKRYSRAGGQQLLWLVPAVEGGYTGVGLNNNPGTPADSNNVYVLRVDATGDAGPCSGTATTEVTIATTVSNTTPTPGVTAAGTVSINNPVVSVGNLNFTPVSELHCFYCIPRATGSERLAEGRPAFSTSVYPNPLVSSQMNVVVEGNVGERVSITLLDLLGNVLVEFGRSDLTESKTVITLEIPRKLEIYNYYLLRVRSSQFQQTLKIFVLNQ